ncbi:capsular biosynthesis protein [Hoeflea ulvae]|uniref:Capsular biosynthesis protein n=1 Tax=Hoeflea ulvae TaxID=2983764 RepID=A0ABT3YKL6_9HYPH|nr:capsular biosynthesis protein [Hoeflea ulvae]MCY0096378.1 capsular biosynthesis protein [Hoeflea ulvae]
MAPLTILFLQGPSSPFLKKVADNLVRKGCRIRKLHFCIGDALMWWPKRGDWFKKKTSEWPAFLSDYIHAHGVTDIVMLGDGRTRHAEALRVGRELGLRIHVFEHGYLRPDWLMIETRGASDRNMTAEFDGSAVIPDAGADPSLTREVFVQSFLTSSLYDLMFHLPNVFFGFLAHPHYVTHGPVHPLSEYAGWVKKWLLLNSRRRIARQLQTRYLEGETDYFLFALQLVGDYQIRNHAPSGGLYRIVNGAISSFARSAPPHSRLLLKIHPLDNGLHNWTRHIAAEARKHGVEDRVDVIDGGDLTALIGKSRGVVTVNSTVGVTALLAHKPVLALGRAIYDREGLTHQASLREFWTAPQSPAPGMPKAFAARLVESTHFRGGFIGTPAMEAGGRNMADRIHANAMKTSHEVFAGAARFRYESEIFGPSGGEKTRDSA